MRLVIITNLPTGYMVVLFIGLKIDKMCQLQLKSAGNVKMI